jgi:glycosyltransferase involved in cell wall biosynthesis
VDVQRSVLIAQPYLPRYRVPLFTHLRDLLAADGVRLDLVVGRSRRAQAARADETILPWATRTATVGPLHERLPVRLKLLPPARVRRADLVVDELAGGCLDSLLLAGGTRRFAAWGHGYGAVRPSTGVDLAVERWLMRRSAHLFVYTDAGRVAALAAGVEPERITVLQNSVDTRALLAAVRDLPETEVEAFRERHDLGTGPVLAFVGGLDASKRIELLLSCATVLHERRPGLRLLVAGDGVQRPMVERFAAEHPWARHLGRVDDHGKALLARVGAVLLNPGRVGLVALDSFAMRAPLVTTDWPHHAPEVAYLSPATSLVVPDDAAALVDAVHDLLDDAPRLARLRDGCAAAAPHHGIEAMAARFAAGIRIALAA